MKIKCKCIIEIEKSGAIIPLDRSHLDLNITKWNKGKGFGELTIDIHEEVFSEIVGESIKFEAIVVDAQQEDYSQDTQLTSFNNINIKNTVCMTPPVQNEDHINKYESNKSDEPIFPETIPSRQTKTSNVEKNKDNLEDKFIYSFEQFMEELNLCKNKKSTIDPEKAGDDSLKGKIQKALAMEQKILEESLTRPCWIMNTSAAVLTINDLPLDLHLNFPKNITGKFTANQLLNSKDLLSFLKSKKILFISPQEADKIFKNQKIKDKNNKNTDIFDSPEEAMNGESNGEYDDENDFEDDDSEIENEAVEINEANEIDEDFASIDLTSKVVRQSNDKIKSNIVNKTQPIRPIVKKR